MKRSTTTLLLVMGILVSTGQDIDSLRNLADTTDILDLKADLSWSLVLHFDSSGNHFQAYQYAKESLTAAQKIQDEVLETSAYLKLAKLSIDIGRRNEALEYLRLYSLVATDERSRDRIKELEEEYQSLLSNQEALENYSRSLQDLLDEEKSKRLEYQVSAANYRWYLILSVIVLGSMAMIAIILQVRSGRQIRSSSNKQSNDLSQLANERDQLKEELSKVRDEQKIGNKSRNQDLILSQKITSEFLSHEEDLMQNFKNSFVFSKARELASGDFLWTGKAGKRTVLLLVDTSSSGIGSTYLVLLIKELMGRLSTEGISAPTMILTMLDQQVRSRISVTGSDDFYGIKAAVAVLSEDRKEIQVSSALLPVYLVSKNELQVIEPGKQPIGGVAEGEKFFETTTSTVKSKDLIYLISDGFEDQLGGSSNNRFSRPSLRKLITSISGQKLEEQSFMFEKVLNDWRKSQPQTDDVTVVGIQV